MLSIVLYLVIVALILLGEIMLRILWEEVHQILLCHQEMIMLLAFNQVKVLQDQILHQLKEEKVDLVHKWVLLMNIKI